jgi:hypothetical protein
LIFFSFVLSLEIQKSRQDAEYIVLTRQSQARAILRATAGEKVIEIEIGFLLNQNGKLILGIKAPKLFQEAIKNLLDFWN